MNRKEIIKALEAHFGVAARFLGPPTFSHQLVTTEGAFTVNREGIIKSANGNEVNLDDLLTGPISEPGEAATNPAPVDPTDQSATDAAADVDAVATAVVAPEDKQLVAIEVTVPMEGHTGTTLRNLVNLVYSKQSLIQKSLGLSGVIIEKTFCTSINESPIDTRDSFKEAIMKHGQQACPGILFDFEGESITFKFPGIDTSHEKVQAYTHLVSLLNTFAKSAKRASSKAKASEDNDKFAFRLFLVRLGMVGDEYKTTRKVLLANLEGNSAFRYGSKLHSSLES